MAERQRLPLPMGGGLDRGTGSTVVEPSAFKDIRNVYLAQGRAEMRRGFYRRLWIPAPWTDILGVYLIRAQGLSAVIAFNAATREVGFFLTDGSGVEAVFVDTLWTIPAGASSPPRVSATAQYDRLIIAHDEPIYPVRQQTMVYSATAATVGPLLLDLGRTGSTDPVYFRGVAKHLAYILAWGYGTNAAGEGDRGDVLRISLPGAPTDFVPEHYFLVGTPGDPIIGGGPVQAGFAVMKIASGYLLRGTNRADFGMFPLDPAFGMVGSHLHAEVNGEMFFWSMTGPRTTQGGPSSDLGFPLALEAYDDPRSFAEDYTNDEDGFAYYDATAGEVVFMFGIDGYALHLRDGARRWSYRQLGVKLLNAGSIFIGGGQVLETITATATPGTVVYTEPSYAPGDGTPTLTVPWTIDGDITTETLEIWTLSSLPGSAWRRRFIGPASDLTATFDVEGFWTHYDVAIRLTSGAFAPPGFQSPDPMEWPSYARTDVTTGGEIASMVLGKWQRLDPSTQGYDMVTFLGPGVEPPSDLAGLMYRAEKWDGSAWVLIDTLPLDKALDACVFANADSLQSRDFRLRPEGPDGSGSWATMGPRIIAPEPPAGVTPGANNSDGANDHADHHDWTWLAPLAVAGEVPADGPYQYRARHTDTPSYLGAYGTVVTVAAGVHATVALDPPLYSASYLVPGVDPSTTGHRDAELEVRVSLVSGDVSPWKVASQFET